MAWHVVAGLNTSDYISSNLSTVYVSEKEGEERKKKKPKTNAKNNITMPTIAECDIMLSNKSIDRATQFSLAPIVSHIK